MEARGLGLEELARIEREEFVHYVTTARRIVGPADWSRFEPELVDALVAGCALDAVWTDRGLLQQQARVSCRRQRAEQLVHETRARFDPVDEWDQFREALWDGRHRLWVDVDACPSSSNQLA